MPIGANIDDLKAKVDEAKAKLGELQDKTVKLDLDTGDFDTKADDAKAKLDDFDGREAKARLDLDDDDFKTKADDAEAKLDELDAYDAEPRLDLDKDDFDIKADEAEARLDELDAKSATINLGGSGGGAGGGGGGFGIPGGWMTGLAGALIGLSPGIGGAAAGLGGLAGVGTLALGGIFKAVSAAHQASQNIGQSSQQLAATEFSNSVQIQQAQQAIGQAHMQSAEDAISSSQQIIAAEQAVGQAEHSLSDAQFSEQQAQVGLTEARIQARLQLQQLENAVKDAALNEKSASLAVQQAKYQQMLVDQNAYSTQLDREQAALAVQQAEQQLTEATQNRANTTMEASKQDRQYFDGQQAVVQAEHALKDAQYGVSQALQQVADAERALKVTREDVAFTQERDAQAVANAEQNLSNTIKEQQLQMAATKASSNQAATQFARDMARMSPAARGVVREILSMRGAFVGLEHVAQTAVAPGILSFLRGIHSLMPEITTGAREFGRAISTAFGQFGREMQTAGFRDIFAGLMRNGLQFVRTVLPAFGQFIGELARVGAMRGAVSGLANLLAGLGHGLAGIMRGLAPFVGSLSSVFSTLGSALAAIGKPLGEVAGALGSALAPALAALLPGFRVLVDALGRGLSTALTGIGPLLAAVAGGISGMVTALAPLLPSLGQLIAVVAQVIAPAFQAWYGPLTQVARALVSSLVPVVLSLIPTIRQLGELAGTLVSNSFATMYQALIPLIPTLANIVIAFAPILATLLDLTNRILGVVMPVLTDLGKFLSVVIVGALKIAGDAIVLFEESISKEFSLIGDAATFLEHSVFAPLWRGIESGASAFVSAFATTWGRLENVFKVPVNFLISHVYDDGIARLWNDVVGHIGLGSLKLPVIPTMAGGGIVPGHDTGRDSQLVAMRPGEGVLIPEAVGALGGPGAVVGLNRAFGGTGIPGAAHMGGLGHVPAFGGGGVMAKTGGAGSSSGGGFNPVGAITGFLSGIGTIARLAAALATGNTTAMTNALDAYIKVPGASGDLAKIMTQLPKALVSKAVGQLAAMFSGGGSGIGAKIGISTGAVGDLPANWKTIASFLAGHGFSKFAAAGVAGNIFAESGGDPEILEEGGGGGGGLIQWTPYPPGYITGNYTHDLYTQLNAILRWGGGPGLVNRGTSPSNAAAIYQDYYERPASLTASIAARMASANAVYRAMGWGSFDSGGWLMPTGMPNATGRPEAVLTPDQSTALVELAESARRNRAAGGGPAAGAPVANFNYFGTQAPTAEQQAQMRRDWALMVGG